MIWLRFAPYIAAAALAATAYGIFEWRGREIDRLEAEVTRLSNNLAACGARYSALIRAKERRDETDRIPDDGLRDVPDGWLLPPRAD